MGGNFILSSWKLASKPVRREKLSSKHLWSYDSISTKHYLNRSLHMKPHKAELGKWLSVWSSLAFWRQTWRQKPMPDMASNNQYARITRCRMRHRFLTPRLASKSWQTSRPESLNQFRLVSLHKLAEWWTISPEPNCWKMLKMTRITALIRG